MFGDIVVCELGAFPHQGEEPWWAVMSILDAEIGTCLSCFLCAWIVRSVYLSRTWYAWGITGGHASVQEMTSKNLGILLRVVFGTGRATTPFSALKSPNRSLATCGSKNITKT